MLRWNDTAKVRLTTPRAVVYPRVSTTQQVNEGTSYEAQKEACLNLCQRERLPVLEVCGDEGISGRLFTARPGLQKALDYIVRGEAQVFVCYKVDRLARDLDILRHVARVVNKAGAQLLFADGTQIQKGANGMMMLNQLGGYAEWEALTIKERTCGGRLRKAQIGEQPCRGRKPMGYHIVRRLDVETEKYPRNMLGQYVIIEDEAQIVSVLFKRYGAGQSLYQLATWLEEEGVPTRRGAKVWTIGSLNRIISNPVYKGQAVFGRVETCQDETRLGTRVNGRTVSNPTFFRERDPEEWITIPCPAIVSEELWDACQRRLATNKQKLSGRGDTHFSLSGLLRCPECGRGMCGTTRGGSRPIRYYHCVGYSKKNGNANGCHTGFHRADDVEAVVVQELVHLIDKRDDIAEAYSAWELEQQRRRGDLDVNRLREEQAQLERDETAVVQAQIEGMKYGVSPDKYAPEFQRIGTRKLQILEALATLEVEPRRENPKTVAARIAAEVEQAVQLMTEDWERLAARQRKQLLGQVVDRITPHGDAYQIRLHPFGTGNEVILITTYRRSRPS